MLLKLIVNTLLLFYTVWQRSRFSNTSEILENQIKETIIIQFHLYIDKFNVLLCKNIQFL